jgi:predicted DsbA family dithiol-disulfide isomerase
MQPIDIKVTYDFICPWCWIGGEKLERAIHAASVEPAARLSFHPYQLNPGMPAAGMDRKAYRSAKFGSWARSVAMDAQVTAAGHDIGLTFDYPKVEKTPNTLAAHRLVWRAQQHGGDASALVKAIFKAYFQDGQDIGSPPVLAGIAAALGADYADTLHFLNSDEGTIEVLASEEATKAAGIHSVPSIEIDQHTISGAQPVEVFAQALQQVTTA